ncbi:MAG TPA: hypothetical protein PKM48_01690 [Parvularculaceae bacterium]|nr:hypothetical protein [Parvularculaceae bacterium]HNS85291.1 hypothetical protein [Parvularculaceae bacterium]
MQAAAVEVSVENDGDEQWARANLREAHGRLALDIANVLRIIELHPDFKGRYKYNDTLGKVLDRGSVMIEWRVSEFVAQIQERFLPEISSEIAYKALVVAANRAGQ